MAENGLFDKVYNPDVLTCLANLSNDEVFTPPEVVNHMLDMLPQELFRNPDTKFLDPACKTGVFLREIAKRLIKGLEPQFPDLQERLDHIFHNQLYGIAITEMTSLLSRRGVYCSKYPNSEFSVSLFEDAQGNIRYKRISHKWENGKCKYCGASESLYERGDELETHAYEFIHPHKMEALYNMKFDVIISNPPYQLDTDGAGKQAKPIYNLFVEQAKKLNPKYMTMIIPSRWFSGGMGLDSFRESMISDKHITKIVDYTNSKDCFPGLSVSGGVCYFLREANKEGTCEFTNVTADKRNVMNRYLDEFPTLVRYNEAVSIIHKVQEMKESKLDEIISSLMPFGLSTSYRGRSHKEKNDLILHASNGITYIKEDEIKKGNEYVYKYKVLISKTSAEHAGEPDKDGMFRIIPTSMKVLLPGEVCTHSYFLVGPFENKHDADNVYTYLKTKFVRFLMLLCISGFGLSKLVFPFVPMQDFSKEWDDKELYEKYKLSKEEIDFIESTIKNFDGGGN